MRAGLWVSRYLLRLSLFFGLTLLGAVVVLGNPQSIKTILAESDTYDRIAQIGINDLQARAGQQSDIPIEDPEIQQIIRKNINAGTVKDQSERMIDELYAWLEGRKDSPDLQIDTSGVTAQLVRDLSDYGAAKYAALPRCTSLPEGTNAFNLSCRPPTISTEEARTNLETALHEWQFSVQQNVQDNNPSGNFAQTNPNIPSYYQSAKMLPYAFLVIGLICAGLIVRFSERKLLGLRNIGWSMFGVGITLIIGALVYSLIAVRYRNYISSRVGNDASAIGADIFTAIFSELNRMWLYIGIGAVAAGLGLVLFTIYRFRSERSAIRA